MDERRFKKRTVLLVLYLVFAILPVYWMINMSFKTNVEILSGFSLWPREFTLAHYRTIFTDVSWYSGYINSIIYVAINTVISLDRKSTRLNSSHPRLSRMPSSA